MIYQNYHSHKIYTNPMVPDSPTYLEDYAKRAVELGHKVLSSVEHGWQGRYFEAYELAKKYNLKFIFGTEAYWVKDRHEKDNSNCHMILLAKNEKGRRAINRILSEANISGFYGRPRIDLDLIFSLPKNDVFITTACIMFWKYDDIENIMFSLHNYFGNNFMLEVQYHNTQKQKELNHKILHYHKKYGIRMIMGTDSHYIFPEDSKERDNVLKYKNINYPHEDGWYLDYPSGEEAFNRFIEQGVLNDDQIRTAIDNTNMLLDFEEYSEYIFSKEPKLPTLYPDKTQEERDEIYEQLVYAGWEEYKKTIPLLEHPHYEQEILKEINIVKNTKMSDYFIIDYYIVKEGIKNGGKITNTGRGSGVSFITNTLLGFSKLDRISAPVTMYPERFMSETRILKSKSLPDLDLNLGNPEVFAEAQSKILGEKHSYPMIAFGKLKAKSAWKLYAGANDIDFDTANEISSQIDQYELDLKYAEENEKELIDIYDYVDEKYHYYLDESKKYRGIVVDKKPHPCAYLIFQQDIAESIGLILVKSKNSKKSTLCTVMDGNIAGKFGYLKNDLLKVDVVNLVKETYKKIGIKEHTVRELNELCKNDSKVWDIYKNGYTMGINQVERESTKKKAQKYNIKNIAENTAFVAAIRPSFKKLYKKFENREHFDFGIPSFDKIIQGEKFKSSWLLYQEQLMQVLSYAGIPQAETYSIIKNMAKKGEKENFKWEKIIKWKKIFIDGFSKKLSIDEGISYEEAKKHAEMIWTIVLDYAKYGFNASHAYSVANDSLYGAFLKSNYPLEFYEVLLKILNTGKHFDRIANTIKEMEEAFGIQVNYPKFRYNNKYFVGVKDRNEINYSLRSIKNMSQQAADDLWLLRDNEYKNFFHLLKDIHEKTCCNKTKIEVLIKIDYFEEFGNSKLLSICYDYFREFKNGKSQQISKKKVEEIKVPSFIIERFSRQTAKLYKDLHIEAFLDELYEYLKSNNIDDYKYNEKIQFQKELMGYCYLKTNKEEDRRKLVILDKEALHSRKTGRIWAYSVKTYSIGSGKSSNVTIGSYTYDKNPIEKYDCIYANKVKKENGYWWIKDYRII